MRNDLKNVPGVSNIQTDTNTNTCDFAFVPGEVDIEAKLTELAETNDHIAGFSIVSQ